MGRTTLKSEYFDWLYSLIKGQRGYRKLCIELHKKAFRWFVPNDDNRCEDGLYLRTLYADEHGLDGSHLEVKYFFKGPCTVFEVLVALAQRVEFIKYEPENRTNQTSRWFFEMVENLGLTRFSDSYSREDRFDELTETKIDEILEVLMDRTYDESGRGGLFPLKKRAPKDQSRVEIWYQLMYYLDENG